MVSEQTSDTTMKTQYRYEVEYVEEGYTRHQDYDAASAGEAFAYCLIDHPGCKLVKARSEGSYMGGYGFINYTPPPVQRDPRKEAGPFRKPKKNEKGCEFPFYDEVKTRPVS